MNQIVTKEPGFAVFAAQGVVADSSGLPAVPDPELPGEFARLLALADQQPDGEQQVAREVVTENLNPEPIQQAQDTQIGALIFAHQDFATKVRPFGDAAIPGDGEPESAPIAEPVADTKQMQGELHAAPAETPGWRRDQSDMVAVTSAASPRHPPELGAADPERYSATYPTEPRIAAVTQPESSAGRTGRGEPPLLPEHPTPNLESNPQAKGLPPKHTEGRGSEPPNPALVGRAFKEIRPASNPIPVFETPDRPAASTVAEPAASAIPLAHRDKAANRNLPKPEMPGGTTAETFGARTVNRSPQPDGPPLVAQTFDRRASDMRPMTRDQFAQHSGGPDMVHALDGSKTPPAARPIRIEGPNAEQLASSSRQSPDHDPSPPAEKLQLRPNRPEDNVPPAVSTTQFPVKVIMRNRPEGMPEVKNQDSGQTLATPVAIVSPAVRSTSSEQMQAQQIVELSQSPVHPVEPPDADALLLQPMPEREAVREVLLTQPRIQHQAVPTPVISQITRQLVDIAAQNPEGTIDLLLSPEELGRVRMQFVQIDGSLTVAIQAERSDTTDLLRRHINELSRDFAELGFSDVSFSFGADPGGGFGDADHHSDDDTSVSLEALDPMKPLPLNPQDGLDLRL